VSKVDIMTIFFCINFILPKSPWSLLKGDVRSKVLVALRGDEPVMGDLS